MYMPYASSDIEKCRDLFPEIRSFERWLKSNRTAMERELSRARSQPVSLSGRLVIQGET